MKRVLIITYDFSIGGSTSSLIAFLNSIDYSKYVVDLAVFSDEGDQKPYINKNVNILIVGKHISKLLMLMYSLFSLSIVRLFFSLLFIKKNRKRHFRIGISQIGARFRALKSDIISMKYDIAISYVEFWPSEYLESVNAQFKVIWFHSDYQLSGMNLLFDKKKFNRVDRIVFVSEKCRSNFNTLAPQYKNKAIVVENLFDVNLIKSRANDSPYKYDSPVSSFIILTVGRLDYYTKGLDRVIKVAKELVIREKPFKWFFLGDGPDYNLFMKEILDNGLTQYLVLLGKTTNPYRYIISADIIVQLSRYEGKPMIVEESKILGKCCLVTEYSSVSEQIEDGVTGLVCSNGDKFSVEEIVDTLADEKTIHLVENNLKNDMNYNSLYTPKKDYLSLLLS